VTYAVARGLAFGGQVAAATTGATAHDVEFLGILVLRAIVFARYGTEKAGRHLVGECGCVFDLLGQFQIDHGAKDSCWGCSREVLPQTLNSPSTMATARRWRYHISS